MSQHSKCHFASYIVYFRDIWTVTQIRKILFHGISVLTIGIFVVNMDFIQITPFFYTFIMTVKVCGFSRSNFHINFLEIPENVDIILRRDCVQECKVILHPIQIKYHTVSLRDAISTANLNDDLHETSKYIGQTLTIFYPEDLTSFNKTLNAISYFLNDPKMASGFWNPIFILSWPTICTDTNEVLKYFENVNGTSTYFNIRKLSAKSDVYVLINLSNKRSSLWEMYTILNITFHNEIDINVESGKVNWNYFTNKISRRSNFQGAKIKATAGNDSNFALETKFTSDWKRFESGSAVNRFWFILDGLNFTEQAVMGRYTTEDKNGSLIGSGLQVQQGWADLAIAQTPMTPSKKIHIDFLQPTEDKSLDIFFVQPRASQYRDIYWCPFERDVWISIAIIWIILLIFLYLLVWLKAWTSLENQNNSKDHFFRKESFILFGIGSATLQGWHILPSSFSVRMVLFVAHLTGFLCYTAFTSSIVSFLSVRSSPLKSVDDIINASYKIYSNGNTTPIMYVLPILQSQSGYPEKVIINEATSIPSVMGPQGGAVIAHAYVFFLKAIRLNFTEKVLCETCSSLPVLKVPLPSGMIVRKGSPYREYFNHQIMLMIEGGFNKRIKRAYAKASEPSCLDYSKGHTEPLEIEDVMSASKILTIGVILSILFLMGERLVHMRSFQECRDD